MLELGLALVLEQDPELRKFRQTTKHLRSVDGVDSLVEAQS